MNNGGPLWLRSICKKNSFDVSDYQIELLEKYVEQLLSWNQKINLISRRSESTIWQQHILGSIAILFRHRIISNTSILDLGTGGGLPGIPLAILLPQVKFKLLDSIQKKILAVNDILKNIQLPNVATIAGRAEEIVNQPAYKHMFDYVISRAVAPVVDILKWGKFFLKQDKQETGSAEPPQNKDDFLQTASVLMLKGGELSEEIKNARMKFPKVKLETQSIIIDGVNQDELFDKKLVIGQF